jgi:hypothetical protein
MTESHEFAKRVRFGDVSAGSCTSIPLPLSATRINFAPQLGCDRRPRAYSRIGRAVTFFEAEARKTFISANSIRTSG